ncbi:MAG: deoxyribonuclease IV [Nitrospinota bacterium]
MARGKMAKNERLEERLLGAHMSISGGVEKAPLHAKSVGCKAMQIFTKSSNQWKGKKLEGESIDAYLENLNAAGIKNAHTTSHDSYLINLGSPDDALREKSLAAFVDEIERAGALKIPYLTFHPGSHVGSGEEEGLNRVAECMNIALEKTQKHDNVTLLIETTAGQGNYLGYKFEHMEYIIGRMKDKKRVGVCFDTCHVLAAGYEIRTEEGYKRTFKEFDKIVGLEKLKIFHLNDSKYDIGSRKDRHEHIGKGFLGKKPFGFLLNDGRFKKIPMVLETPKGKDMAEDKMNLNTLRKLIK